MTLHNDAIGLLRELLAELDSLPATRLLLGKKGSDYYTRGRAIVARAEDLAHINDRKRLRESLAELARRYRGKNHVEHAMLEALINARSACAQVGDGDSMAPLETAGLIVERWFAEHPDEPLPQYVPPGGASGGPFAGSDDLFDLHTHTDPGDVGRRA